MQRRMTLARLLSLLLALTATGSIAEAQNTTGKSARTKSVPKQPTVRDGNSNASLSEQECREFAQAIVKAVSSGDQAALNALFDWDSLFDKTFAGLTLPETDRKEYIRGLRGSITKDTGLMGQIIKNTKTGGKFDYLRTRQNHGGQVIPVPDHPVEWRGQLSRGNRPVPLLASIMREGA
jgi:hypothetical protein